MARSITVFAFCTFVSASVFAKTHHFLRSGDSALLETHLAEVSGGKSTIDIEFLLPSLDIAEDETDLHQLKAKGLFPLFREGKPEVLTTGIILAIPQSSRPQLEVIERQTQAISDVWVSPCTQDTRCDVPRARRFRFDRATYSSDTLYPSNDLEITELGQMQSIRWIRVGMNPLRWQASTRRLEVTYRMKAKLHLVTESRATSAISSSLYTMARNASAEPNLFEKWFRQNTAPEKMIIFVADSLKNAIAPLVEWKQARGLEMKVVTFQEAGGTKEKLLSYLKSYYAAQTPKPSYLLFVGNKTTMPPYFESTSNGQAASDMRFALLEGTDNVPDIQYGRIVADNEQEVSVQVQKWVNYEKAPDLGSWYPQAAAIASDEGSGGPSDKEYANQLKGILQTHGYQKVDVFLQGEKSATYSNIASAVNGGRTWMTYIGHGSGESWGSTNDNVDVGGINRLSNGSRLPILIDVACKNAAWTELQKCFGKAWAAHPSGGSVGYYGGSVNISWHEPAVMSLGIAKYHFEKSLPTLGASVNAGQLYLVEKMGNGSNTFENLKWYNLFGDPSLIVRTDLPKSQQVDYQVFWTDQGAVFLIRSVDAKSQPIVGLTASISRKGENPLGVGPTDATGIAKLLIPNLTSIAPDMLLTVTGVNVASYQKSLP